MSNYFASNLDALLVHAAAERGLIVLTEMERARVDNTLRKTANDVRREAASRSICEAGEDVARASKAGDLENALCAARYAMDDAAEVERLIQRFPRAKAPIFGEDGHVIGYCGLEGDASAAQTVDIRSDVAPPPVAIATQISASIASTMEATANGAS